jgi:hypothetical protein
MEVVIKKINRKKKKNYILKREILRLENEVVIF